MKTIVIALILCASTITGCDRQTAGLPAYLDHEHSLETRVEDALERMTDDEKRAMVAGRTAEEIPGVARLGIPAVRISDSMFTQYPDAVCLAATWDPSLAALFGHSAGAEARFRNIDVLLGPGVDILRSPLAGNAGENLGEDPLLASRLIAPYMQAIQEQGVAATIRRFALHNQETFRDTLDVRLSDRALYEIYLPAFRAAIQQGGAWALEPATNRYNETYCADNKRLLNDILVEEWAFDGVVLRQGEGDLDVQNAPSHQDAADVFADLDEQVRRLLRLAFRTSMDRLRPWGSLGSTYHTGTARAIAEGGIVLLKNDENALPLETDEIGTILIVGPNAPLEALSMRFGSRIRYARGYTTSDGETQPLEEIADAAQNVEAVVFVGGLESDRDSDLNSDRDSGTDRDSLALPDIQNIIIETLVAANPRTTVVIHSAGPVAMPWRDSAAAIVQAWHLGADGDQALAAVIAGEINPSGKLPFTYYSSLYECGAHVLGDYPGDPAADYIENYVDDIWVGYRYTDMKGDAARPAFPFGHGLSYTTFEYSDIKGNKETIAEDGTLKISLRVTNTGHRLGHEVVQLYIGDTYATAARPVKELKDFQKVMLEPGRSTRVTFTVDASMLSFFDPLRHDWIVEPGNFNAYIASSAGDIRGVVEFSVL